MRLVLPIQFYRKCNKKPVFLVFTPEHANLGDHAIAYSEELMLREMNIEYFEITGKNLYTLDQFGYLNILNKSLILINGGGNLGTLWPEIERMNRQIIMNNPDSSIFILPNSIYYDESNWGKEEFIKSKTIYNNHKQLYLYAREEISFSIMKTAYTNVKLIPDMVLFLNESKSKNINRFGCILCLRNDSERTMTDYDKEFVLWTLNKIFENNIVYSDTVLAYNVNIEERENELKKKLNEFKKSRMVVTDRLHGMIFAAITGTKCIVLNSKSPKMKGCYRWIKDLKYIKFLDDINSLEEICKELLLCEDDKYNTIAIQNYLELLKKDISSKLSELIQ